LCLAPLNRTDANTARFSFKFSLTPRGRGPSKYSPAMLAKSGIKRVSSSRLRERAQKIQKAKEEM
jgi:hypothetical protein